MKYDNPIRVFLGLLCLAGFAALLWGQRDRALSGENDFIPFYVGAVEAGGEALYDAQTSYRFQEEHFGAVGESLRYIRLPYYALLLKPLTWLGSYENAYAAYTLLRLLAIVLFIWLWPREGRWDALMFALMSLPLFISMMTGQDTVLLLPLIAWAMRLSKHGKDFEAGLILSLCAIKPHLLLLLPVALVLQNRWAILQGGAIGGILLMALSFAAGGLGWMATFIDVLRQDAIHPDPQVMPNLVGLLAGIPYQHVWTVIGSLATLVAVALIARRGSFETGLAAATAGSLLIAGHAYISDLVILLPGMMALAQAARSSAMERLFAFAWLGPVLPLLLLIGRPASYAPQFVLPLTLLAMAIAHQGAEPKPQQTVAALE